MSREGSEEALRLLKSLSYRIHRKEPPEEALAACIESEGRGGRHRQWRQAMAVLSEEGFVPALVAGNLVGEEAAAVLSVVARTKDHRLLSDALDALVDRSGADAI